MFGNRSRRGLSDNQGSVNTSYVSLMSSMAASESGGDLIGSTEPVELEAESAESLFDAAQRFLCHAE